MDNPLQKESVSESPFVVTNNATATNHAKSNRRVGKPIPDMPTTWSDKLAHAVQKFPCLYDPESGFNRDMAKKELAWNTVGAQLGITGDLAKAKWRIGRDNYTRFKRAFERFPIQTAHLAVYYKSFRFLENCGRRNRAAANSTSDDAHSNHNEQQGGRNTSIEAASVQDMNNDRLLLGCLEATKQSPDALDLMCMSFAATMRRCTPAVQAQIELKMRQVKVAAEIEMAEQEQRN